MALPRPMSVHDILRQQSEINARGQGTDGSGEPLLGPSFVTGNWMEVVPSSALESPGAGTESTMVVWVRDAVFMQHTPAQWGHGRHLLEVRLQGVWARALATLRRRPNLRLEDMILVLRNYRMEAIALNERVFIVFADDDRDAQIEMRHAMDIRAGKLAAQLLNLKTAFSYAAGSQEWPSSPLPSPPRLSFDLLKYAALGYRNVYGIVAAEPKHPKSTRRGDLKSTILLTDPSLLPDQTVTLNVFARSRQGLLAPQQGDIVRLLRVQSKLFCNRVQLAMPTLANREYLVFDGAVDAPLEPKSKGTDSFHIDEVDANIVKALRHFKSTVIKTVYDSQTDAGIASSFHAVCQQQPLRLLSRVLVPQPSGLWPLRAVRLYHGDSYKFRCRVRVVDYAPKRIEDFCREFCWRCKKTTACGRVCDQCGKEDAVRFEYFVKLLVEDSTDRLDAIACKKEARQFFAGLPPCDLNENNASRDLVALTMTALANSISTALDCDIMSYACNAHGQPSRRYQIFSTSLCGLQHKLNMGAGQIPSDSRNSN